MSCHSASACVAVGSHTSTMHFTQTLAETWHAGKWSIARSANHVTYRDGLDGVSCVSASSCFAVGSFLDPSRVTRTLIESWNGSHWSIMPSPHLGTKGGVLDGISCRSARFCVAVGSQHSGALAEKWNGSTWSILPTPNSSTGTGSDLLGVSCASASSCTAVGHRRVFGGNVTLVESWNGKNWSVVPSPNGPDSTYLTGVSCVSATSCTAAGWFTGDAGLESTLTESWNGSTWSITSSPDQGAGNNALAGVSCRSPSLCTAVGAYVNAGGVSQALTESWNGSTWSISSSPDQGAGNNTLAGVSCRSASFCIAVGAYVNASGASQPLIESWNGGTWSIVPSLNLGAGQSQLLAVSCATTTSCVAVGDDVTSAGSQFNLAERSG